MPIFYLILLLTAFPALSTDMYLPAIPALCTLWGVPLTQANLTLAAFFISFSTFLLVHGPLADQCGKRPVLIGGISTYILGSLLCAGAGSITWLILARVAQAFGAAAAAAMSLALAKDLYSGDARKKLLAYIGVLIPLCPMIAPTIGAFMLEYVSWRGIFLFQAFLALPTLYGSFRLQDPTPRGESGGLAVALKRYATLMRNKNYMVYVLAFSLVNLAFFAFVGGSSDIYIRGFGLSESRFGLFFAFNALGLMLGSLWCSRLCVSMASRAILFISCSCMLASSVVLLCIPEMTPIRFALPMFCYSLFMGMSRPISNDMILEQVQRDTGTAASLLTFFNFLCGGIAMELISFDWPSKPTVIGVLGVLGTLLPLVAVLRVVRKQA